MIRRREFITLLGGATAGWPMGVRAQQPKTAAIGYLRARSRQTEMPVLVAYHAGLREAGYVEGENVAFDYRFADGRYDELPAMAADLVRRKVDVIAVLGSTFAVLSAKQATQAIPIVFQQGADPIAAGLVTRLSRPGGNVTGTRDSLPTSDSTTDHTEVSTMMNSRFPPHAAARLRFTRAREQAQRLPDEERCARSAAAVREGHAG
jgi:hypothetical protein